MYRRALLTVTGGLLAVTGLFVAYLRMARAVTVNSDGASNALQAWDLFHGNPLLRGWTLSDVSFYPTELVQYGLVQLVIGVTPDQVHVTAAITWTLVVLLAVWLAGYRSWPVPSSVGQVPDHTGSAPTAEHQSASPSSGAAEAAEGQRANRSLGGTEVADSQPANRSLGGTEVADSQPARRSLGAIEAADSQSGNRSLGATEAADSQPGRRSRGAVDVAVADRRPASWSLRGLLATGARTGWLPAAVAVAILVVPSPGVGYQTLLSSPNHTGSAVPLLLAWLLVDRVRDRRWMPLAVAAVLAWGALGDPLITFVGAVPLVLVAAVRAVGEHRRRAAALTASASAPKPAVVTRALGAVASAPDAVGPDAVGPDAVGPDAVGPDAVGPDAVALAPVAVPPALEPVGSDAVALAPAVVTPTVTSAPTAVAAVPGAVAPAQDAVAAAPGGVGLGGVGLGAVGPTPGAVGVDVRLALAGVASVVGSHAAVLGIERLGGFRAPRPPIELSPVSEWPTRAVTVGRMVGVLDGTDRPGVRTGWVEWGLSAVHWPGLVLAVVALLATAVAFLRGRADRLDAVLAVAVACDLGAEIVSTLPIDLLATREIAPVLPMSAVLAARVTARWLSASVGAAAATVTWRVAAPARPKVGAGRRRVAVAGGVGLAVVLLAQAVSLAAYAPPRAEAIEGQAAADWLVAQGLRYGLGSYWVSNNITVGTSRRVTVVPTLSAGGKLTGMCWQTHADMYDASRHDARFVLLENERPMYGTTADVLGQYGPPRTRKGIGPYTIFVYDRNLLDGFSGAC